MDNFANRRDNSTAGQERRERFARLLSFLVESGIDSAVARGELLKVARGGESELLSRIRPPSIDAKISKAGALK